MEKHVFEKKSGTYGLEACHKNDAFIYTNYTKTITQLHILRINPHGTKKKSIGVHTRVQESEHTKIMQNDAYEIYKIGLFFL